MFGIVAAAVVVAAAAGGGAAFALHHNGNSGANVTGSSKSPGTPTPSITATPDSFAQSVAALNNPTDAIPAGWSQETVSPTDAGSTAGFTMDIPPGWTETRKGLRTYFYAPERVRFMEVDLTPHTETNMVAEAEYIEKNSVAQGKFPGYKRNHLHAEPVLGTMGAFWQLTFAPPGSVRLLADDILFVKQTSNGSQSYALFFRGPNKGWGTNYLPLYKQMLRTFRTVPS